VGAVVAAGSAGWVGMGVGAGEQAASNSEAVTITARKTIGKRFIVLSLLRQSNVYVLSNLRLELYTKPGQGQAKITSLIKLSFPKRTNFWFEHKKTKILIDR
jgi:hypothetical protein